MYDIAPSLASYTAMSNKEPVEVDLVFSYYDEVLANFGEHLTYIKSTPFVRSKRSRIIIYNKGDKSAEEIASGLGLADSDRIYPLPNVGREGSSYLHHILTHYNNTITHLLQASTPGQPFIAPGSAATFLSKAALSADITTEYLAPHTYFLQPHLAWRWMALPRLDLVTSATGFAHFGPYVRNDCGRERAPAEKANPAEGRVGRPAGGESGNRDKDGKLLEEGQGYFGFVRDLFEVFGGGICVPDVGQLVSDTLTAANHKLTNTGNYRRLGRPSLSFRGGGCWKTRCSSTRVSPHY